MKTDNISKCISNYYIGESQAKTEKVKFDAHNELMALQQQLQAEQQAHNALKDNLKTIEWVEFDSKYYCPICKRPKTDCISHITKTFYKGGHSQECWLNKSINTD